MYVPVPLWRRSQLNDRPGGVAYISVHNQTSRFGPKVLRTPLTTREMASE